MVEHVSDVPAVIRGVVDHVQQYVLARHGAGPSTDVLELDHFFQLPAGQGIGIVDVPGVDPALGRNEVTDGRVVGRLRWSGRAVDQADALPHEAIENEWLSVRMRLPK